MREVSVIETLGKNRRRRVLADTDFRVIARVLGKRIEVICGNIELAHFHMFGAAEKLRRESVCQTRRRNLRNEASSTWAEETSLVGICE